MAEHVLAHESRRHFGMSIWAVALLVGLTGCSDRHSVAPVEGKVIYRNAPVKFGSVSFQPEVGPRATGRIQADGTFRLSTYGEHDGAILGRHRVRIVCAEHQNPDTHPSGADSEGGYSRSLIPEKYTFPETSGFEVEVKQSNEPFTFELND
ncbi:MAG TPA: hypothetical protein DD670_20565 [Planctomycetaceae bacterium]|nr:hypothetical protein [Planctomycetaceae bacterium]